MMLNDRHGIPSEHKDQQKQTNDKQIITMGKIKALVSDLLHS